MFQFVQKKSVLLSFSTMLLFILFLPIAFSKNTSVVSYSICTDTVGIADKTLQNELVIDSSDLYNKLKLSSKGLSKEVFEYALSGLNYLKENSIVDNNQLLTIADLSKPSSCKRLFVIDLKNEKILFNTYVAHGVNSGIEMAKHFSNCFESNQTSLGFYKTEKTYIGGKGYSLHLKGLERGFNDNAEKRDIVMHGADYVNENFIQRKGYIGRSFGCPSIPVKLHKKIIDKIKNGTCLFIYGYDEQYLSHSGIIAHSGLNKSQI